MIALIFIITALLLYLVILLKRLYNKNCEIYSFLNREFEDNRPSKYFEDLSLKDWLKLINTRLFNQLNKLTDGLGEFLDKGTIIRFKSSKHSSFSLLSLSKETLSVIHNNTAGRVGFSPR